MTLTERHPSVRLLALSILIGVAAAVFLSATVTFFMWQSGATWGAALDTGWRLGTLLALACPSAISAVALIRYAGVLPQNEPIQSQPAVVDDWEGTVLDTLPSETIRIAAKLMITLKYRQGIEPTRDLLSQRYKVSQPVWNSARRVLQEMDLVQDRQWAELAWADVAPRLGRLRVDRNAIWCPHKRGMGILHVSDTYDQEKKSYIID